MQPRIAVISGVRLGGAFTLSEGDFVIGRDNAADLSIADVTISLRHCVITVAQERCYIQDCDSLNGTALNGVHLAERRMLRHGDRIGVGGAELVFLLDAVIPDSPVHVDASPMNPGAIAVSMGTNDVYQTIIEFGSALRFYRRDIPSMRKKMLSFLFTKIPAECAALLFVEKGGKHIDKLAHNRIDAARPVRVNQAMAERVYREGKAMMSPSVVCVPMQGFDGRLGVIFATTSDRHAPFNAHHFELLSAIATVGSFALEHAAHMERLEAENSGLKRDLEIRQDLVGDSTVMTELGWQIARVAPTDATLLIQGESGTGKELVAHAVHRNSKRASGSFIAINCGAIPENLLESELFGHEKGAFTGALFQKKGKFEAASGGTLFLDEIAELPATIQVKLLRVLEGREIERLGGTKPIKVDIRLIAATHRDLEAAVAAGKFRHDLYFRLKVITIETPPLRDRDEDILHLARHFVARFSREMARSIRGISPDAERMLKNYRWPGNVRELRNIIERAIVVGSTDAVMPEDLPRELTRPENSAADGDLLNIEEVRIAAERDAVERAFAKAQGNWKEAAALLGINRTHLYKKVEKLGMTHLRKPH